jgi:hypothetical protein
MIPVRGDHSARIPAACGSSSRIRFGPISSRPSTPLAVTQVFAQLDRLTPLPAPDSGRVAVKLINHCGDEILKVSGV